jgi:hypothetical protein
MGGSTASRLLRWVRADEAGSGAARQSVANPASLRSRWGLSPAVTSSCPATSVPSPDSQIRVGLIAVTSGSIRASSERGRGRSSVRTPRPWRTYNPAASRHDALRQPSLRISRSPVLYAMPRRFGADFAGLVEALVLHVHAADLGLHLLVPLLPRARSRGCGAGGVVLGTSDGLAVLAQHQNAALCRCDRCLQRWTTSGSSPFDRRSQRRSCLTTVKMTGGDDPSPIIHRSPTCPVPGSGRSLGKRGHEGVHQSVVAVGVGGVGHDDDAQAQLGVEA